MSLGPRCCVTLADRSVQPDDLIVLHAFMFERTRSELDGQSLVKRSEILVEYIYLVSWLHSARLKSGS